MGGEARLAADQDEEDPKVTDVPQSADEAMIEVAALLRSLYTLLNLLAMGKVDPKDPEFQSVVGELLSADNVERDLESFAYYILHRPHWTAQDAWAKVLETNYGQRDPNRP